MASHGRTHKAGRSPAAAMLSTTVTHRTVHGALPICNLFPRQPLVGRAVRLTARELAHVGATLTDRRASPGGRYLALFLVVGPGCHARSVARTQAVYYRDSRGGEPVGEFIGALPPKRAAKIDEFIE
jgi:hypothetical protein